jgi:outer membrane protein assembly factor BamE
MQTLFIPTITLAAILLASCSLDKIPGVYRINVQQGNVVTQEMVDQLRPGMDKRQVRFVLGTPLLIDVFHQDRWDYAFTMQPGGGERTEERVSVFFENDGLARVVGDRRLPVVPRPPGERAEALVEVPVREPEKKSLLRRFWDWITPGGEN